MTMHEALELAVKNVAAFGDTDVFPSTLDRFLCQDRPDAMVKLLLNVHKHFDEQLAGLPPENIDTLAPLGYMAFRWATQIDPMWNLYYLSLVISISETIEAKRLPQDENAVFSYRFGPDLASGHLFSGPTWRHYKQRALTCAKENPFVLVADVADFYPTVNHHRLDNELRRLGLPGEEPRRIMELLSQFTRTRSYGLPVGGPASRILAELALNPVDLYLNRKGVPFCRYVDDFHIFANSKQEAYHHLAFLSQILFNEGLSLQKTKTRIMTSEELAEASAHLDLTGEENVEALPPETRLMRLSVRYDPYSPTAEEDYEALREAVTAIDIVGILAREIAKTTIDTQVMKQAISAVRALPPYTRKGAVASLLDTSNLETLAPVFSNVMRLLRSIYAELDESTRELADSVMMELVTGESYLVGNDLNLAYLLQVFGMQQTPAKERVLIGLFDKAGSQLVRREIVIIMARWGVTYWLTELLRRFGSLSRWERKAFIVASYHMQDEGKHWRDHIKPTLSETELLIRDWYADRMQRKDRTPL